jgi:Mg2+ and Co2+ transporter CorA
LHTRETPETAPAVSPEIRVIRYSKDPVEDVVADDITKLANDDDPAKATWINLHGADTLSMYKDETDSMANTYMTMVSHKTNDVMKVLTIVSTRILVVNRA